MKNTLTSIITAFIILIAAQIWQTRSMPHGDAPQSSGIELQTSILRPIPANDQSIQILYFFAPWCGVCKLSTKNAETVATWIPSVHVTFVGLDFESPSEIQEFATNNQLQHAVLIGNRDVQAAWHIEAYPTYAIIDRQGKISSLSVGYSTTLGMAVRVIWAMIGV